MASKTQENFDTFLLVSILFAMLYTIYKLTPVDFQKVGTIVNKLAPTAANLPQGSGNLLSELESLFTSSTQPK